MLILGAATPVFKLSVSCFPLNPCRSSPTHLAKNYPSTYSALQYLGYHTVRLYLTSSRLLSQKVCLYEHDTFCYGSHSRNRFQLVVVEVGILAATNHYFPSQEGQI